MSPNWCTSRIVDAPVRARRLLAIGDHQPPSPERIASLLVAHGNSTPSAPSSDEAIGGARLCRQYRGPAGHRQEPAGPRNRRHRRRPRCRGVRHLLRVAHQRHPLPRGGATAARGDRTSTNSRLTLRGSQIRAGLPDADPKTCCSSKTFSASAIPRLRCPMSPLMRGDGGLTALLNSASLARTAPAVYVIEDAHWIDEASESMLRRVPQRSSPRPRRWC